MVKQNAFLAAHEAKLRAEFQEKLEAIRAKYWGQLSCDLEVDLIAHILGNNKALHVGPGRADRDIRAFLEARVKVADLMNEDGEADVDLEYSKRKLADRVKAILGPENWDKYKEHFPLLRTYWED